MAKTTRSKRFVQGATITVSDGSALQVWAVYEAIGWFLSEAEAKAYAASGTSPQKSHDGVVTVSPPSSSDKPNPPAKSERHPIGFRMTSPEEDSIRISRLAEQHVIRGGPLDTTMKRGDE